MKLNDEQQMLQDSVARLMADKGPVSHLRELRDHLVPFGAHHTTRSLPSLATH